MKAIIIGGFSQFIGHVVEAYSFDPIQNDDGTLTPLFSTDPPKFVNGNICKFYGSQLSFLPEVEDELFTMYDGAV